MRRFRPALFLLLLGGLWLLGQQFLVGAPEQSLRRSRILMGTVIEITVFDRDAARFEGAVSAAFAEMARIEELMSPLRPYSDLAHIAATTRTVAVTADTAAVIAQGLTVAEASGGAFDLGLGRVKALWGIETEQPRVPSAAELAAAIRGLGPAALHLEGQQVSKGTPELAVDLGGIAKGYAVDRAANLLRAAGVERAAINAGGNIRLLGERGGRPWRIGIQHPCRPQAVVATLLLSDISVATSGDYERFFLQDGIRYHHIFDPRTGYPARLCQSVTVLAANAMLADALSTAVFVLGPQQGLALLARFPGCEGLIVDAAGKVQLTSGLQGLVEWP